MMAIPAELYVAACLVMILIGMIMRSTPALVFGAGALPLAVVVFLIGHDVLIETPVILVLVSVLCLCVGSLTCIMVNRLKKKRASRARPRR